MPALCGPTFYYWIRSWTIYAGTFSALRAVALNKSPGKKQNIAKKIIPSHHGLKGIGKSKTSNHHATDRENRLSPLCMLYSSAVIAHAGTRTRTGDQQSASKCSKGLRCLCRKPFAFNPELVAGGRFELTTFGYELEGQAPSPDDSIALIAI